MSSSKISHPANDIKLGVNCIVCEDAKIEGDVTIGNGTIIHPRASILAEGGPIIIGEHNIIEDKAVIINRATDRDSGSTPIMIIGNCNVFEVASRNESLKIGDYNVFEAKSFVGREVVVSNNCIIGAGCIITVPEVMLENCAYYGPDSVVRISQGHQPQILQMEYLTKILPNYHHLMRKKKSSVRDPAPTPDSHK